MHLTKGAIVDSFYMLIFGVLLSFIVNDGQFLTAFGFYEPSYFASLGIFVWLYVQSIDVPLRVGLNWFSRSNEL